MSARILVGTDPEYFVVDSALKPVPAHTLGFDDKHNKKKFKDGKAFRDGYAIEINVAPSSRWDLLTLDVRSVMCQIQAGLPYGHRLLSMPTVKIDLAKDLDNCPVDLLTFGCDPSMDAYTGMPKLPDINAMEHPMRYAGGHLHFSQVGIKEDSKHWSTDIDKVRLFIRMMDVYVGLPLTVIFDRPQTYLRRRFYGQAGEFRHQKYEDGSIGIEYRTPGPEVFNHPAVTNMVIEVGKHLFENFERAAENWSDRFGKSVQEAINTGVGRSSYLESLVGFYSSDLIRWMGQNPAFMSLDLPNHQVLRSNEWATWVGSNLPEHISVKW